MEVIHPESIHFEGSDGDRFRVGDLVHHFLGEAGESNFLFRIKPFFHDFVIVDDGIEKYVYHNNKI